MKFNIEVECTDNSRVTEEKLHGHIIRAIAGVVANNCGIITSMSCETREKNIVKKLKIDEIMKGCELDEDRRTK